MVYRARDHFFSSAALTQDQYRMPAVRGFRNDPVELVHLWRPANDASKTLFGFDLFAQNAVLSLQLQVRSYPLQKQLELLQAEWFRDVIVGAGLHSLHCRFHGAVPGD